MAVLEDVQTQEGSIFPMGMHWQSRERVSISVWKKGVKNCWIRFFDQRGLVKKYCMFPAQTGESEDVFTLCLQSPGLADELNGLEYDFLCIRTDIYRSLCVHDSRKGTVWKKEGTGPWKSLYR